MKNIRRISQKGRGILPLLLILAALTAAGCARAGASTGGFDPGQGMVVKGNVAGNEVDLNTKIPGKVTKILVEEGQSVAAGALIAEIDNTQLLAKKAQVEAQVQMAKEAVELQKKIADANVQQASGAYKAAEAQLSKANAGARTQELAQAKAYYEMMEKTYVRVVNLCEKGAIPAQKKDEVETQLKVAKEQYSMAKEGARAEDVAAAQGLANQASGALSAANASRMQVQLAQQKYQEALAGLDEVNSLIADTRILSPKKGTIVELNCDPGELVSTGTPIATVADLKDISLKMNVFESYLPGIRLGQQVQVRFSGTGDKIFNGTVKGISAKPHFAVDKATNNGEDDVLAYEVRVAVENLDGVGIYPGMTAYVQFSQKKIAVKNNAESN